MEARRYGGGSAKVRGGLGGRLVIALAGVRSVQGCGRGFGGWGGKKGSMG